MIYSSHIAQKKGDSATTYLPEIWHIEDLYERKTHS